MQFQGECSLKQGIDFWLTSETGLGKIIYFGLTKDKTLNEYKFSRSPLPLGSTTIKVAKYSC